MRLKLDDMILSVSQLMVWASFPDLHSLTLVACEFSSDDASPQQVLNTHIMICNAIFILIISVNRDT